MSEVGTIDDVATQPDRASGGPPVARLQDVRFAWRANEPNTIAIDRFELAAGERVFIEGPSGSGKSTLLSLLGGVIRPSRGRVELLGEDVATLRGARRDRFRADHVGFVFQLFNLVPYLSMLDNVTLPCWFSKRRRMRAVERDGSVHAGARRLLAHLELDRAPLLARSVTDLSIGQQQRVAVARALIGRPEVVIADEPTSALDEGNRERFLELLFAECSDAAAALLFVSHDRRLGAMFDRRLALDEINATTELGEP